MRIKREKPSKKVIIHRAGDPYINSHLKKTLPTALKVQRKTRESPDLARAKIRLSKAYQDAVKGKTDREDKRKKKR